MAGSSDVRAGRRGEKSFALTIQQAAPDNDMDPIPPISDNRIDRGCRERHCLTRDTAGRKIFRPYGLTVQRQGGFFIPAGLPCLANMQREN